MQVTDLKALYDRDFAAWAEETARLLEQQQFDQLDLPNLIEEVWDLSKRERDAPRGLARSGSPAQFTAVNSASPVEVAVPTSAKVRQLGKHH